MTAPARIGNAHGFWGDRLGAAAEMLEAEPDLDYLTLDFLAEVSMSILAAQQAKDPQAGYPRDFVEIVRSLAPYWKRGGACKVITNAGGLNPLACAQACQQALREAGCLDRTIAVVLGDNVLDLVRADAASEGDAALLRHLDTGEPVSQVADRLVTANAYLGAEPLVAALQQGADVVIAGRVADPSLTVAACAAHFGWPLDDWQRMAGATVAGHLIECGAQIAGGISTDWLDVPGVDHIGFPIVEVSEDASVEVTKPRRSGGRINRPIVAEQLVYEIGDPQRYLSPDATVSFQSLQVEEIGADRVRVRGAQGKAPPPHYKVSATYRDGYRAQGMVTVFGQRAVAKAQRAAEALLSRLARDGVRFRHTTVETLGAGACRPQGIDGAMAERLIETVLRIAVADASQAAVERFSREFMSLVTAGPPGTTGYAEGRPRVHPMIRYWPCLIERGRVSPQVELLPAETSSTRRAISRPTQAAPSSLPTPATGVSHAPRVLGDLAIARSGDKGIHANIGVIAREPVHYPTLCDRLSCETVAAFLGIADANRVERYELPNLHALNFIVRGVLSDPLRTDAQGKALGQVLLTMPLTFLGADVSP